LQQIGATAGMRVKLKTLMFGSSSNPATAISIQSAGVHVSALSFVLAERRSAKAFIPTHLESNGPFLLT